MTNPPIVVTAPEDRPFTLPEIKLFLREDLTDTENDAQILLLFDAALEHVEGQTSRRIMEQTLKCFHSGWPCGDFRIPVGPVISITHIKYYGSDDTEYTVSASDYAFDGESNPPIIRLKRDKSWPSVTLRNLNPVEIQFVAGYQAATEEGEEEEEEEVIPDPRNKRLKNAVAMLTATLYRNRETVVIGNSASIASLIPQHFQAFIDSMAIHA